MCDPTAQDYYSTERFDDVGITGDDRLLRHLRIPVQIHVDEKTGTVRISDQAFTHPKANPGASVDIECLLHHAGLTEMERRGIMPNSYAMIAVTAANARSHSDGVAWTPKPAEPSFVGFNALPNEFHGEIIGHLPRSESRKLAAKAQLVWTKSNVDPGPFKGQNPEIS